MLPDDVDEKAPIDEIIKRLGSETIDELVVLTQRRDYVGLVTRESLFTWWTQESRNRE